MNKSLENKMDYWFHKTIQGTFYIVQTHNEYDIMFRRNCLGTYDDPQKAIDDLVSGHTTWPSFGNPSTLDMPENIEDWKKGPLNN